MKAAPSRGLVGQDFISRLVHEKNALYYDLWIINK